MSDRPQMMKMDLRDLYCLKGAEALRNAPLREWHPVTTPAPVPATIAAPPFSGGKKKMSYRHCDELVASLHSDDLVQQLLIHGDVSVVYGASNVGKSFWVLDLATSIANSAPYRGKARVDGGAVVYVTLEGRRSFANRISALKKTNRLNPGAPLYIVNTTFNLLTTEDCDALVETVAEIAGKSKTPVRLIVVDTLARAMAGGDENSSTDMTSAVRAVDEIKTITGAHVMLIHHPGKNEAKGARGHSSLRAAIDTEIEVSKSEGSSLACAIVTKQRDLPAIPPMLFKLDTINIGIDNYGENVTSCVVHHEFDTTLSPMVKRHSGQTKNALCLEKVLALVPETGMMHKAQLKDKIRRDLGATVREAESVIRDMLTEGTLSERSDKSASGQRQIFVTRERSK
jgi:hypothetical protein